MLCNLSRIPPNDSFFKIIHFLTCDIVLTSLLMNELKFRFQIPVVNKYIPILQVPAAKRNVIASACIACRLLFRPPESLTRNNLPPDPRRGKRLPKLRLLARTTQETNQSTAFHRESVNHIQKTDPVTSQSVVNVLMIDWKLFSVQIDGESRTYVAVKINCRGGSGGGGVGGAHEAFFFVYTYSLLKLFLPHRQWRHCLEVPPS